MFRQIVLIACLLGGSALLCNLPGSTLLSLPRRAEENETLRDRLFEPRYVAYSPTNWNPEAANAIFPSDESIRQDLQVLRRAGFDGLVTYGGRVSLVVPRIAEQIGFRGILLGVWDPTDSMEMENVKLAARSSLVVGIIVGNEGLMFNRYNLASLKKAMNEMKRATGKPVSTTEVIESYMTTKALIEESDFLLPNAHPFFHGNEMRQPRRAAEWTNAAYQELSQRACGKPLLFKEVGLPTGGDVGLSEENQAGYYALLMKSAVKFVFFEAFDCPWKSSGAVEPHWGLFRADRSPKSVVTVIMQNK
jgi:exo-beta-1,3-glucanase (GH17 family)